YPSDSIRKYLRGEAGSEVTLTVIRNQKSIDKTIRRGQIPMSSVDAAFMINPKTGFIRLNRFSSQTYREFMLSLDSLVKAGMQSLVLDLRENGGGVLDEAVEIADEFLEGDKLITYTEGRKFPRKEYRCRRNGLFEKGKLVVLADENTASASEVLLGALQDWDRATIIGRRTFGKGLVQEQYNLSDKSAVRLTIARYYTPTGRSIQRPYENGRQAYYENHAQRPQMADSAAAADTGKVFQTRSGKKIYAGGGISPDIWIPSDSLNLGEQVLKAVSRGLINDAAYFWLIQHPGMDKKYASAKDFAADGTENASLRAGFIAMTLTDSIPISSLTEKETGFLDQRLKAAVTRLVWRNEGYFEVLALDDPAILKALEILKK
ncbi:MAG TPA: S41 family peptidase, partial [Ferruginibacter sp.]|nr:S41 family peptidase [Ferruginibacter sp.]